MDGYILIKLNMSHNHAPAITIRLQYFRGHPFRFRVSFGTPGSCTVSLNVNRPQGARTIFVEPSLTAGVECDGSHCRKRVSTLVTSGMTMDNYPRLM